MSALAVRENPESLVDGEFAFTRSDFQKIAGALYRDSGIHLSEEKVSLVYSRLAKRLRALGLESFRAYCDLIEEGGSDERQEMLASLTTNVTRFFREPHHFDDLRRNILEPNAEALRAGARLRLWSAACSSGQEPYSLAMTILSVLPNAASLDIKILATDIDPAILRAAQDGRYTRDAAREIPQDLLRKYFRPLANGGASPSDELRSLISFRELNLIGEWPVKGPFQAIFCRNVVIYFDGETQARVWKRMAPLLDDAGRLYIGHSERVSDPAFRLDGLTAYRLHTRSVA